MFSAICSEQETRSRHSHGQLKPVDAKGLRQLPERGRSDSETDSRGRRLGTGDDTHLLEQSYDILSIQLHANASERSRSVGQNIVLRQ